MMIKSKSQFLFHKKQETNQGDSHQKSLNISIPVPHISEKNKAKHVLMWT